MSEIDEYACGYGQIVELYANMSYNCGGKRNVSPHIQYVNLSSVKFM